MFKYTLDNKRYHTLNYYFKQKYGKKTFKVSLNGNFSCPNKINGKGCIFCSRLGSGDFAGNKEKDLITQFNEVKTIMAQKWPDSYYIGYFQANTNTFAPVNELKEKYETILSLDNVVGLNIATRSDAISEECYEYLSELNKKTNLIVELGLQSIHEKTLKFINRGHDLQNFEKAIKELQKRNIETIVHIINGLPGETKEMMLQSVKHVCSKKLFGLKLHMFNLIKGSTMELTHPDYVSFDTIEEYIDLVIEAIEMVPPETTLHRISGDAPRSTLIHPHWSYRKRTILNGIHKEMRERNTWQGKNYK